MKSESFLTMHGQQHNYHVQGPKSSKDIVKIVVKKKILLNKIVIF